MRITANRTIDMIISRLSIIVIYFSYLQPAYFDQFRIFDLLFNSIRILSFIFLVLYYVLRRRIPILFLYAIVYSGIIFLVTLFNQGDIFKGFRLVVIVLGALMWTDYLGVNCPDISLNILDLLMTLLLCANYLTIIIAPNGLYHYSTIYGWSSNNVWLLGLRNAQIKYLGLACFCSAIKYYYSKRSVIDKIRIMIVHGITLLTVIKLKSGGGYVMLTAYYIMLVVIIFFRNVKIDFSVGIIFHVALFVLITLFSATMLFSGFFELFGKNGTASNRITLWAAMWSNIIDHPIFGHGYMLSNHLGWLQFLAAGAVTGHNAMLDIFFHGGLVAFICFVLLLFETRKRMAPMSHHTFIYNYSVISFVAFYLIMQSEGGMDSPVLFLMIGILSNLYNIHSAEETKRATMRSQGTRRILLQFRRA